MTEGQGPLQEMNAFLVFTWEPIQVGGHQVLSQLLQEGVLSY